LSRRFQTIEDAEAFICHRVVRAPDASGWTLTEITASRDRGLNDIIEGTGYAEVRLRYRHDSSSAVADLAITPFAVPRPAGERIRQARIEVSGRAAFLYFDSVDNNTVFWRQGDLELLASVRLNSSLTLQDFLEFLASFR
jgi:hypothetical protein